ncbi:MAG: MarR family transcriptional regulator [Actinobacteria bacterium]|nr:MarR family transcriptional regulator [Actinomycetota bacterium]
MARVEIPEPYLTAWRAFLNAHAATTEHVEAALAAADLPPLAWYDVLWPLYDARRLRMGELATRVVTISRSGLTRLVDRVEAAGLVRREACDHDRRGTDLVLTAAGKAMLRRMWPVYARVIEERFVAVIGRREAEELADTLGRVGARAPAAEPTASSVRRPALQ